MKKLIVLFALASIPAFAQAPDTAPSVEGKAIFEHKCQGCHGADGAGHTRFGQKNKLPNFSSSRWQEGTSDQDILNMITNGSKKNPKMKSFKDKLSPEEIQAVAHYIRGLSRAPAAK